jgi:hypothetical protein
MGREGKRGVDGCASSRVYWLLHVPIDRSIEFVGLFVFLFPSTTSLLLPVADGNKLPT